MPKSPRRGALTSPHDALFKWTFSQREHAVGLLKAALPPVLPLLIHHSDTGWTAARAFQDIVGGEGPFSVITAAYLVLAALSASQAWPRYRAKAARVGRKFDAALDRIEAAVRAEGTETTRHAEPAPRPLLDLEDEPAADAAPALRGRTRA